MAQPYEPALKVSSEENEVRRSEEVLYWTRLKQITVFSEPSQVTSVAMSNKHPHTVASTAGMRLALFDTVLCEQSTVMTRFKKAIYGVSFRADGALIGLGGDEGKLRIMDQFSNGSAPKAPLRSLKAAECSLHAVRFGALGGHSVYSLADDGILKQWDFSSTTPTPISVFKAHNDAARVLVPSSTDEHLVLTGGYDHTVKLWDVRVPPETGATLRVEGTAPIESALFLHREQVIAVASGPIVRLYDISAGGRCLGSLTAHHKAITSMALVHGGEHLLTASIDKRLNVVRTQDLALIHSTGLAAPILSIAAAPDDSHVAIGMGNLLALYRREEPTKDKVVPLVGKGSERKTHVPKGVLRPALIEERGETAHTVDPSSKLASEYTLSKEDTLLRRYKHAALITRVFTGKSMRADTVPDCTVGWLTVIISRHSLGRALAGQPTQVILNVIKFVSRHLFKIHYFHTLSAAAECLFDVCRESTVPAVNNGLLRLRDAISRELCVQKELAQSIGALEMLITPVVSYDEKRANETEDLFGNPVFDVIPLSSEEITTEKIKDNGEEKDEEKKNEKIEEEKEIKKNGKSPKTPKKIENAVEDMEIDNEMKKEKRRSKRGSLSSN